MIEQLNFKTNNSALILSAGKSERFGEPKFMLPLPNGKIFLENIIDGYLEFGCEQIVVVINPLGLDKIHQSKPDLFDKADFVINDTPILGRFFSIKLGINQLESPKSVFIQNVDNPFVSYKTLITLNKNLSELDYVFPRYKEKGGHPILVSKKIIESIVKKETEDINFKTFLNSFRGNSVYVDDKKTTLNINTSAEYKSMLGEFFGSS